MKNLIIILLAVILSVIASLYTGQHLVAPSQTVTPVESTFDRIMRTKTIRCAYTSHPPIMTIDPNTKNITGIFPDVIEDIAHRLNLKVNWVEEVGYGNINTGFVSGRYDVFCGPLWPTATRASSSLFTLPIYFSPAFIWVRADDNRFNGDYHALNDARYTVSITDGDVTQSIADHDFPLAKRVASTQSADVVQRMQDVAAGKSDATIVEPDIADAFVAHNPNSIKNLSSAKPIRVYQNVITLPSGEYKLKTMFDTVIGELYNDGSIQQTVKKYMGDNPPLYFVGKPYETKAQ